MFAPRRFARRVVHTLTTPDARTLRGVLGGLHIGFASTCFYRPNLFEMYATWQGFQDIASPVWWGVTSTIIGLLLLGLSPARFPILLVQAMSICFYALVGLQTTEYTGYNTGTPMYFLLSFFGMLSLFASATLYLECLPWYVHLQWRADRWRVRRRVRRGR